MSSSTVKVAWLATTTRISAGRAQNSFITNECGVSGLSRALIESECSVDGCSCLESCHHATYNHPGKVSRGRFPL